MWRCAHIFRGILEVEMLAADSQARCKRFLAYGTGHYNVLKGGEGGEGFLFVCVFSIYARDKKSGLTQQDPDLFLYCKGNNTQKINIYTLYTHASVSLSSKINSDTVNSDIYIGAVEVLPIFRQDAIFQLLLLQY